MEFISWSPENIKPLSHGHPYNRKMFGVETLHKSGEWKSLITHKDFYELLVEIDEVEVHPIKVKCHTCPPNNNHIHYSNVTHKLGSFSIVLVILFVLYFF